jgi:hypothetical protein
MKDFSKNKPKDFSKNNSSVDKINSEILPLVESIIGNLTTTNFELNKIGKALFGKKYLGTFASDRFPKVKDLHVNNSMKDSSPKYCILNLDKTGQAGSHWVSCVILKDSILIYDSFGRKTSEILPDTFNKGQIIQDTDLDPEQDISEFNCGARCIAALVIFDEHGKKMFLAL